MTVAPASRDNTRNLLIESAKALDSGDWDQAVAHIESIPVEIVEQSIRAVALALWKRIILSDRGRQVLSIDDPGAVAKALAGVGKALETDRFITWPKHVLPVLEQELGSRMAANIATTVLWERTYDVHPGAFEAVFDLSVRGGNGDRTVDAWRKFVSHRKDYVPGYWTFLHFAKLISPSSAGDIRSLARDTLIAAGRNDLMPLTEVYLLQMRQAEPRLIFETARRLADPAHRDRVVEFVQNIGFLPDDLEHVVKGVEAVATETMRQVGIPDYMQARLANAEGRWEDILSCRDEGMEHDLGHGRACLQANALANLGRATEARRILAETVADDDADKHIKARAAFVAVNVELLDRGIDLPRQGVLPPLAEPVGRPLAQSLWVGRRLRWIERLSIKSYLDNGWRFQLYVYDDPENVPEGCEVLDASAIIPRKEVFREGFGSGLHAGSVGGFSDLFRYRLLQTRGGLWTDTDVINFRRYDADGRRFVSTEVTDAGFITLNGAIMAAPAGDSFVSRAYERASEILNSEEMFFTRIGPYLLAELVVEAGVETVELMPPDFLSRVFWMNTATLLKPYEDVMATPAMTDLVNLHVYTEMWRLLGLGLDAPPGPDTFIGRLYADHFPDEDRMSESTAA